MIPKVVVSKRLVKEFQLKGNQLRIEFCKRKRLNKFEGTMMIVCKMTKCVEVENSQLEEFIFQSEVGNFRSLKQFSRYRELNL